MINTSHHKAASVDGSRGGPILGDRVAHRPLGVDTELDPLDGKA